DIDRAQVQVQNRVSQALPRLPEEVRSLGVNTVKASSNLTLVVNLTSPNGRYDSLYLRNYAVLNIRDVLARLPGMGDVQGFGGGDYSMRVWLDPQKLAARNLTAGDVVAAIREQNVQVAAGQLGAPPSPGTQFQIALNAAGRLTDEQQFRDIIVKTGDDGQVVRLGDIARVELGAQAYGVRSLLDNKPSLAIPVFQSPGANALELSGRVRKTMEELKKNFPEGMDYGILYDPTQFVQQSIDAVLHTLLEAIALVALVLVAVFGPVAFVSGLTGEFYRQFALTIAISTVISAFNSLTLSPALAAVLLKPHGAKPDLLTRAMNRLLGRFFKRFNTGFAR